jgi:RNA polymerase sigma factor (sigma-70 family)
VTRVGREDEDDLAERFRAGDESALREAYGRWSPLVFHLARGVFGSREDAEDVTQAVFVSAWRGRAGFSPERGELGGWLVGIARHRIADLLEEQRKRTALQSTLRADLLSDPPSSGDIGDRAMISEELDHLSPTARRVVELAYYRGLSQAEIASELGLPVGTVKSHLRRSLHRIRSDWEAEDGAH